VDLGFRVRVPAHLCTLLLLASSFASSGASPWVWGGALFYGLIWPHVARFAAVRSRDSRAAELRNLLGDAAFSGGFIALVGFSLWPSVVLLTGFNSACLSVGGVAFALRALALCAASAVVFGFVNGYRFTPDSSLLTSIICAVSFVGYTVIFSLRTHIEAKRLVRVQRELRASNQRTEEQRQHVEHALYLAEAANVAKSNFLANMSHELRTPLNAIIGYAELLEEDPAAAQQRSDLQKINAAGKHLLGLINDLLDLSKIEAGGFELQYEHFDVDALIDQTVSAMRPLMDRNGNRFERLMPAPLGSMTGDPGRLRQVLLSLLSNAAKFTHGGKIHLSVARRGGPGGERLVIEICDTGIGMSPEQVEGLFTPFMQADSAATRKYGGTGLGLAISRRLCTMMGGDIEVRSELGRGTCFTVALPVDGGAGTGTGSRLAADASGTGTGKPL
jgi:signal transduction histidine kinase